MNAINSFCQGFKDGTKVTAKVMATTVLVGVVLSLSMSFFGFFIAMPLAHDGMTIIWGPRPR